MRFLIAPVVLLSMFQSCVPDYVRTMSRDRVRQRAETGLRKYFPQARVEIDTAAKSLVTYTCVSNLSTAALETFAPAVESNSDFAQLRRAHTIAGLQTFALVFDRETVTFDLAKGTHTIGLNPSTKSDYFTAVCHKT